MRSRTHAHTSERAGKNARFHCSGGLRGEKKWVVLYALFWERRACAGFRVRYVAPELSPRRPCCDESGFVSLWNKAAPLAGLETVETEVQLYLSSRMSLIMSRLSRGVNGIPHKSHHVFLGDNFAWILQSFHLYHDYLEASRGAGVLGVERTPREKIEELLRVDDWRFKDTLRSVHGAVPATEYAVDPAEFRSQADVLGVAFMLAYCNFGDYFLTGDSHNCLGCSCPRCSCPFACCSYRWLL